MQIKFFTIPVMGGEALTEELNGFRLALQHMRKPDGFR